MKAKQKEFALVGFGFWGKNIFRNLYDLKVLHTACDNNLETIEGFKAEYPDVNYTDSFTSVLNNPKIKAVLLATPASTHFTMAREALLAGKDVFVEKPLSLTVEEGQGLLDLKRCIFEQFKSGLLASQKYHAARLANSHRSCDVLGKK